MKRLDFSVFIGLSVGLAAIGVCAFLEGIRLRFLWQPTAALVVFGGTLGAVVIRRGINGLKEAGVAAGRLCFSESGDEMEVARARLMWLARAARHEGVRAF